MAATALIINADDLGLAPSVDTGIFQAWAASAISDSSVLANSPRLAEVLQTARAVGLPVGVHLNLTLGRPLSEPAAIPAFVSDAGTFMKRGDWPATLPIAQIRLELRRQVQRVRELGWQPSHLDSHHHVHRYPQVLAVVVECARELEVPVRAIDAVMRDTLRRAGVATPDHFTMAFYGAQATVATLQRLVQECPGGTLEMMTHPGLADAALPSSYREERAQELTALCASPWQTFRAIHQLPLIGFHELRRSRK